MVLSLLILTIPILEYKNLFLISELCSKANRDSQPLISLLHTRRLYGIVCFKTELKNNDTVVDALGTKRTFRCYPKDEHTPYTQYFLEAERISHKIEVIVLEEYLYEQLNLKFSKQKF